MDRFKSNYNNFKMNPKFYWKPLKRTQNWRDVIKLWNLKNKSCCGILEPL